MPRALEQIPGDTEVVPTTVAAPSPYSATHLAVATALGELLTPGMQRAYLDFMTPSRFRALFDL